MGIIFTLKKFQSDMIIITWSDMMIITWSDMIIITWSKANIPSVLYLWSSQSVTVDLKTRDTASEWTAPASSPANSQRILRGQSDPTEFLKSNGARIPPNGRHPRPLIVCECEVVPLFESHASSPCFDSFSWPTVSANDFRI